MGESSHGPNDKKRPIAVQWHQEDHICRLWTSLKVWPKCLSSLEGYDQFGSIIHNLPISIYILDLKTMFWKMYPWLEDYAVENVSLTWRLCCGKLLLIMNPSWVWFAILTWYIWVGLSCLATKTWPTGTWRMPPGWQRAGKTWQTKTSWRIVIKLPPQCK